MNGREWSSNGDPGPQAPDETTPARRGAAGLTPSERHELLASDRRRLALDVLAGWTGEVTLAELAAAVATREGDSDGRDEATTERVAVRLHHDHLPRMADAGLLDYYPGTRRIDPDRERIDAVC